MSGQQPKEVIEYEKTMKEIQELAATRQKLLTQQQENEMVKKELELVEDDDTVYKYNENGELEEEDPLEAEMCVDQRLEYLAGELKKLDTKEKELNEKIKTLKAKIIQMQKEQQAAYQAQLQEQQARLQAQAQAAANKK